MEIIMIIVCGILTAISVYLILSKVLFALLWEDNYHTCLKSLFNHNGWFKMVKCLFMKRYLSLC